MSSPIERFLPSEFPSFFVYILEKTCVLSSVSNVFLASEWALCCFLEKGLLFNKRKKVL